MPKRKNENPSENEPEAKVQKTTTSPRGRGRPKKSSPATGPPTTRSKSPIRAKVKPVRAGLKRMSTMEETASEAMAFLQAIGSEKLLDNESTLPQTRARKEARAVLSDMLGETVSYK